jgi:hypothetical protein
MKEKEQEKEKNTAKEITQRIIGKSELVNNEGNNRSSDEDNNNYCHDMKTSNRQLHTDHCFQNPLGIISSSSSSSTGKHKNDVTVAPVVIANALFIEKIARSIAEIQQNISSAADVMIFLEILGYDDEMANRMGYHDLVTLARFVFPNVHFYSQLEKESLIRACRTTSYNNASQLNHDQPINYVSCLPSLRTRIQEGFGIALPWLSSLFVLYAMGISLWMSGLLPTRVTTFFIGGVFIGLVISEGLLQVSTRQFSFYYSQQNFGEVRRTVIRNYIITGIIIGILMMLSILVASYGIPSKGNNNYNILESLFHIKNYTSFFENGELGSVVLLSIFGMVSIILHRSSFMIIYAMKKISYASLSYGCGLAALIFAFYSLESVIPNNVTARYMLSLSIALATLTTFAIIQHIKIFLNRGEDVTKKGTTNNSPFFISSTGTRYERNIFDFYSPPSYSKVTLRSNFSIQLLEGIMFFAYGAAYFLILFEDRLISWLHFSNGLLVVAFNSTYHMGADLALLILFASGILQYVYLSPIYTQINNVLAQIDVSHITAIGSFLQRCYKRSLLLSLLVSGIFAMVLQFIGPLIIEKFMILYSGYAATQALEEQSVLVMRIMSISYMLLAIILVNIAFLILLNKVKPTVIMLVIAVVVNAVTGLSLLELYATNLNASVGSLVANIILTLLSSSYLVRILKDEDLAASSFLSRFV